MDLAICVVKYFENLGTPYNLSIQQDPKLEILQIIYKELESSGNDLLILEEIWRLQPSLGPPRIKGEPFFDTPTSSTPKAFDVEFRRGPKMTFVYFGL